MNTEITIQYLGYKMEDDLRTMRGKNLETKAACKGLIYLREFHTEIPKQDRFGILVDAGHDPGAIKNSLLSIKKEKKEAEKKKEAEEKKEVEENKEADKCKQ